MNGNQHYIFESISQYVKIGFLSKVEIKEAIDDLVMDEDLEDQISSQWITDTIDSEFKILVEQSKLWIHPTDNEKLERVFDKLWTDHKIIALHNAGYTIADGEGEVIEVENKLRSKGQYSEGYCFYHEQDVERVINNGDRRLFLAYQKIENEDDEVTRQIGHQIVEELRASGFQVNWDEKPSSRIEIFDFNWKKIYDENSNVFVHDRAAQPLTKLQSRKFSEIQYLLPADSWARWRDELNKGEFKNEICLFIEGDWETTDLNLDEIKDELGNCVFLILVSGDMKCRNIYCKETDGATGLIVLGSLEAENMLVGGQQIYVCENLTVKSCYWGDYNHGDLIVNGAIAIDVFISTDYGFNLKRFKENDRVIVNHFFWDEEEDEFPRWKISGLIKEDCLLEESDVEGELYGWNDWLQRDKMIDHLKAGESILQQDIQIVEPIVEIPFLFKSEGFNNEDFQRMRQSVLFLDNMPLDENGIKQSEKIEYWRGDIFKRVLVIKDVVCSESIYFQKGTEYAILVNYKEVKPGLIKGLLNKGLSHQLSFACRDLQGDDQEWHIYHPSVAPLKFNELMQNNWKVLLHEFSEMEHYHLQFQEKVTVGKIEHILSLPVVKEKYSGYYNEEEDKLWFGETCYTFRQLHNERGKSRRISIIHDQSTDEEKVYDFYHFDIAKLKSGETVAVLFAQDSDGFEAETYEVSISNIAKFKKALHSFAMLERKIEKLNTEYLEELKESEERRLKAIAKIPLAIPFKTIEFNGYEFTGINLHQANDLLKDLKDLEDKEYLYDVFDNVHFPNDTGNGYFLLADEDVVMPALELDVEAYGLVFDFNILGFIFLKDLTLTSHLKAYDADYSPALIVKGNLSCKNINLSGNIHYVEGAITCEFLYAEYNHGGLYVKGRLTADCVVAEDMPCYFGEIVAGAIVSDYSIYGLDSILDEQGNTQKVLNFYPDTHFLQDVLVPEVLGDETWGLIWPVDIETWITEGKSAIDRGKDLEYRTLTDESIVARFDAIFNHKLLADSTYRIAVDENEYAYTRFDWNGKQYREVAYRNVAYFRHQLRILHSIEEDTYTAYLEYKDRITNVVKMRFSSTLTDTFTSTKAVKHAFYKAEQAFLLKQTEESSK